MCLHSSYSSGDCENRLVLSLLFWTLSIATHPRFTIPRIRNSDVPGFFNESTDNVSRSLSFSRPLVGSVAEVIVQFSRFCFLYIRFVRSSLSAITV